MIFMSTYRILLQSYTIVIQHRSQWTLCSSSCSTRARMRRNAFGNGTWFHQQFTNNFEIAPDKFLAAFRRKIYIHQCSEIVNEYRFLNGLHAMRIRRYMQLSKRI